MMHAFPAGSAPPAVPEGVCDAKCRSRCSLKKAGRCMGLCMMCCADCEGCVPSGPYASKDECPCYRDKKSPKRPRPSAPSARRIGSPEEATTALVLLSSFCSCIYSTGESEIVEVCWNKQ